MKPLMLATALAMLATTAQARMPHNRPCDKAQDNPGNLNPEGGNAIMFGLCGSGDIEDAPVGVDSPSRHVSFQLRISGISARQTTQCQPLPERNTGNAMG